MIKVNDGAKVRITAVSSACMAAGMGSLVGNSFDVLYTDADGDIWVDATNAARDALHSDKVCVEFSKGWNCELVEAAQS